MKQKRKNRKEKDSMQELEKQFLQVAREYRDSNRELPDEGTVSETDKVS